MIKDQVEELIEESYLLSLSETEIRNYLRNFLESCEFVLSQQIAVHENMKVVGIKIALLKVKLMLSEWSHYGVKTPNLNSGIESDTTNSNVEMLVKQVMEIKVLIHNLLARVSPRLKEDVVREAVKRMHSKTAPKKNKFTYHNFLNRKYLIIAGYFLLLPITLLILAVFIYF